MPDNSIARITAAIAHALREDALPAVTDEAARGNLQSALQLLDLLGRQAVWNPAIAERTLQARRAVWFELPARPPGLPAPEDEAPDAAAMDAYAVALAEALPAQASGQDDAVHAPLRRWLLAYGQAAVERTRAAL